MDHIQVKCCKDHYTIQINNDCFSFQKNPDTTELLNILYPLIEHTKNQHNSIQPHLHDQYHNSILQIIAIQKMLEDLPFCEMAEQKDALENILYLTTEWNYFLQDIFKAFNTDYPQ